LLVNDLTPLMLSQSFTKFSIPAREDGFDDVRYEWSKKAKVAEYIKDWVLNKKLTTRIEDLVPSDSFNQHWIQWQQQLQKWRLKQNEWKEQVKQAALRKEQKRAAAEAEKLKAAQEKERAEKEKAEKEDGEKQEDEAQKPEESKVEEKKAEEPEEEDEEPEQMEVDSEFDIFSVTDICDTGKGRPLFADFTFEDWALMSLRFELHTLAHAFRQDVNDLERVGVHVDHLLFYYNKYFRKNLNSKYFGVETFEELVQFVSDSAKFNSKNKVLESHLAGDLDSFDIFVKLTEECRRERHLLIDSGKEEAVLKFSHALAGPSPAGGSGGFGGQQQARSYQRGPRVQQAPHHQQKGWHAAAGQQVQQVQYKGGAAPAHSYNAGAAAYNPGKGASPGKGGSYGGYGGKGAPAAGKGYAGPQNQAYGKGRQYSGGYNKGYGK